MKSELAFDAMGTCPRAGTKSGFVKVVQMDEMVCWKLTAKEINEQDLDYF